MVPQVRPVREWVKVPRLKGWPAVSVVVEVLVLNVESVPYAKPRTVTFVPPTPVRLPLRVAVVAVTEEASRVSTVGTTLTSRIYPTCT